MSKADRYGGPWIVILLVSLWTSGCASPGSSGPPGSSPAETDDSPERYLTLTSALENINSVIRDGNDAYTATQDFLQSANAFSPNTLDDLQQAQAAWERVEVRMDFFTADAKTELPSLEEAIPQVEAGVAIWFTFLESAEQVWVEGGGLRQARRLAALEERATTETRSGMLLMEQAASEAVNEICGIDPDAPACFLNSLAPP